MKTKSLQSSNFCAVSGNVLRSKVKFSLHTVYFLVTPVLFQNVGSLQSVRNQQEHS